jgi:hypothetical protein
MPLRKAIAELATDATRLAGKRKVQDFLDGLLAKVGIEDWFVEYLVGWAKTGEPGPFFDTADGKVFRQDIGLAGQDKTPMVWAMATPFSDPRELAREFLDECLKAFPDATWDRMGLNAEGARYCRLFIEGMTDRQIADDQLAERYPETVGMVKTDRNACLRTETDRVRKTRTRFFYDYADRMFGEQSANTE